MGANTLFQSFFVAKETACMFDNSQQGSSKTVNTKIACQKFAYDSLLDKLLPTEWVRQGHGNGFISFLEAGAKNQ